MTFTEDMDFGFDDWSEAFYLFNCAGYVRDGDWWHSFHEFPQHKLMFWETDPEPQYANVLAMIKRLDKKARKKARMIIVGPHIGISLCLEGLITPEHLTQAKQTKTTTINYIDIANVRVAKRKRLMTVRVIEGDRNRLQIANGKGKVLSK